WMRINPHNHGSGMSNDQSPPLRVMALHALAYCERLFYLEEVEELYVADDRVYAGRELLESLGAGRTSLDGDPDEPGQPMSLDLSCPTLGLVGRVDVLKRRNGQLTPYEHKRGRARRGAGGGPLAREGDGQQAGPHALTEEGAHGVPAPEVRVRYHR